MSAHKMYIEKRKQIDHEIEILKQKLESMDIDESKDNLNYGYVGNCEHILEIINDLNYGFMKNN